MKNIIAILTVTFVTALNAQAQSDPFGTSYNYDSTSFSDSTPVYETYPVVSNETVVPEFLPYVRFKAPMDTVTQKVTYMGIVPFKPMPNDVYEGGDIDSLYWRAKKFLLATYVKNFRAKATKDFVFPKDILVEDFKPDPDSETGRIIITPTIPLVLRAGNKNPSTVGTLSFKLELRVKADKYKYKVTNFVHHTKEPQTEKPINTYAEFYVNSKHSPRSNDQVLLAIDREVKVLIKSLNVVMKDPIIRDEDDF